MPVRSPPELPANLIPLFSLDAGPNSNPNIDPATAFPAVPSNGFIPLTPQLSGTHIRPIKQVLPTVDAWNATLQRQVTNTISAEVAYVGSKGTHGFAGDGPNYDINPARVGPGTNLVEAGPQQSWPQQYQRALLPRFLKTIAGPCTRSFPSISATTTGTTLAAPITPSRPSWRNASTRACSSSPTTLSLTLTTTPTPTTLAATPSPGALSISTAITFGC